MHNTVVTIDEIAAALNRNANDMGPLISALQGLGFPSPVGEGYYDLSRVLDWLVAQQEMNLALVTMLSQKMS